MQDRAPSFLMEFLSPYSYRQKFIFISLLFAFSILVCGYFMIVSQNEAIRFVEKELKGLQYLQPIRKLMEELSQHKQLARRYLSGNNNLKEQLVTLQTEMTSNFNNLVALDQNLESYLATSSNDFQKSGMENLRPAALQQAWYELVRQVDTMTPSASDIHHDQVLSDLKSLAQYIVDSSNLTVDPQLDTHYLIQGGLVKPFQLQELLPQVTSIGAAAFQHKNVTDSQKTSLVKLIALMQDKLNDSKTSIQKLFNYERIKGYQNSENKLKELFHQYLNHFQSFMAAIQKEFLSGNEIGTETAFLNLSQKARQASWNFWDASIEQLTYLLNVRLHNFIMQQRLSIALSLLSALAGFLLGFLIMREISRPLTNLVTAAKHLAGGDLSTRVPVVYKDEVGQVGLAFNQMSESFQELIGQLQWTGIQLTTSTTEIAAAAKQQEATIVEQEATTKEIAATAREISTTAKEFAKTMSDVSSSAEQTSSLASEGKAGLTRMETIMRQMVDAAGNIASKLAVLNEKAGSITSIVTTIGKVADQTNLLSLNAAIEAEKAGEYGRSFAVIAREIRRLADQTASATLDIEKMVNEMVSAVSAGVMGVDKFSEEINTGVKQASTVGEQLSKIIEQVQTQTSSFETVNQGMQAQSLGAEQIDDSIKQLSEAAQQATKSIRQFQTAIDQLNNAAQEMQNSVSRIKR